ncbi:uncharacterized protein Dana_GF12745 [Drosophila ananassae]|uniref:Uncharacterized protein n=2 Tax=Drosophila ananassae TaxID=7217 RepID=B3MIS1_DROAN|nr:uncharacterized protein Dana_GF12745 [Drosophila ananassae]
MRSVRPFEASLWLLLLSICAADAGAIDGTALQELAKLNLTQAKLISDNTTVKCMVTPDLCDWQIHLYEGHAFSVPLPQAAAAQAATQALSTPAPEVFELSPQDSGSKIYIVAEVKPKPERRRRRKLRRRTAFNYFPKRRFALLVFQ